MQTELFQQAPKSLHDTHKFLHSIYAFRPNQDLQLEHINTIFEGYNSDDEVLESREMSHCAYVKVNNQSELDKAILQYKTYHKRVRFLVAFKLT